MKALRIFLLPYFLIAHMVQGQSKRQIVEIEPTFHVDPANPYGHVMNVSLISTKANGKKRRTGGDCFPCLGWKRFAVTVTNASFRKGVLTVDKSLITKENHKVAFTIKPLNNAAYSKTVELDIPYLQEISLSVNNSYLPGDAIHPEIRFHYSDGKIKSWKEVTPNEQRHFTFRIDHRSVEKMDLRMPGWNGHFKPYVTLTPVFDQNDSIGAPIQVPYQTEKEITILKNGFSGRNGRDGRSNYGRMASNGRDGLDGENGEDGENGSSAANLEIELDKIWVDSVAYVKTIVREAHSGDWQEYYQKSGAHRMFIHCKGGDGGNGGDGSDGTSGKSGENANDTGRGGNGGQGGYGGHAGDGGQVDIIVAEANADLVQNIVVSNHGGQPGQNGKGGRKGSGGSAKKESVVSSVFYLLGSRGGSRGQDGVLGRTGRDGGLPKVILKDVISTQGGNEK